MSVSPSEKWVKSYGQAKLADNGPNWQYGATARETAKLPEFIEKCSQVGVKPSIRKARDFRRKLGKFS